MLFSAIPSQKEIIKLLSHPQDDRFQYNLSHYFHKARLKLNQAVTKFASFPKLNVSDIYCGPSVVHFNFDLSFSILFLIFRFSSLSNSFYLSLSLTQSYVISLSLTGRRLSSDWVSFQIWLGTCPLVLSTYFYLQACYIPSLPS